MRAKLRQTGVRAVFVAFLLVGAGAGAAYATGAISTGSSAVIVGCAKNENGQLRIVGDASQCLSSEHAVTFQAPLPAAGPQAVVVDCAAGQTVTDALAQTADAPSVDITIKGTCTETVTINRDHVFLHGAAPGDGLQAPSSGGNVVQLANAHNIDLRQLTLTGGDIGLSVGPVSSFNANDLTVHGSSDVGVLVANASAGFLNNATVDGASQGLGVSGGALGVNGGTIENSRVGVYANAGGSLQLDGGVLITGSTFMGVSADHGGSVNIQNATVQNSGNTGVMAFSGGSAFIGSNGLVQNNRFGGVDANAGTADVEGHVTGNGCGVCAENGGRLTIQNGALVDGNGTGVQLGVGASFAMQQATIRNNTNDGVHLQGTASGMFNDNNTITGNGGWGIFCDGPPAVAQIQAPQGVGDVSGNSAGQIDCPTT